MQGIVNGGYELIDTLWNVNSSTPVTVVLDCAELIDTLWNVNNARCNRLFSTCLELIDTLWNVNIIACDVALNIQAGINRYIMECKFKTEKIVEQYVLN